MPERLAESAVERKRKDRGSRQSEGEKERGKREEADRVRNEDEKEGGKRERKQTE